MRQMDDDDRELPAFSRWEAQIYAGDIIEQVWQHGEAIRGNDSALWRKDEFGAWIHRLEFGNRRSEYGWEIFNPRLSRHEEDLVLLRPLQWQNYIDQVAARTQSRVTAEGLRNTRRLL